MMRKGVRTHKAAIILGLLGWLAVSPCGQAAPLPMPRLLTLTPSGGQAGTTVEVTVGGTDLDEASELRFSAPTLQAKTKGPNLWTVTIPANVPPGIYDVRVLTGFGISTPRAFVVGDLPEAVRTKPNTTPETAMELKVPSVCNAHVTAAAVDYYSFAAKKGERLAVDCAAAEIDSKLVKVLILADAQGRDLLVNRRGGALDWTAPGDGKYFVKVHSLTFEGGPEHFYRLTLTNRMAPPPVAAYATLLRGRPAAKADKETEPNNKNEQAQKVTLPCVIEGAFHPAADVDFFEFTAKRGEAWWVEVTSQRLGLKTDPFVVVQRVTKEADGKEKVTDVVELNDIANPIAGTPYDAGSSDALGKLAIAEDGIYRLQVRDLFGGTRSEPRNVYRLEIRKAEPSFDLVAWPFNAPSATNDRSAPAKPMALRKGATLALQVAAVRKDGLAGEIELRAENLPAGVTATGSAVPAGKTQGFLFLTAGEKAPGGLSEVKFIGRAMADGNPVERELSWASVVWPVGDTVTESPRTRLAKQKLVSVSAAEVQPISIASAEAKVFEGPVGNPSTVPLKFAWRGESTAALKLKVLGTGFEAVKEVDVPLKAEKTDAVLDLAALKTPPGEYTVAFYGVGKGKYRRGEEKLAALDAAQKQAEQKAKSTAYLAKVLTEAAKKATPEEKAIADQAAKEAVEAQKAADAAKVAAVKATADAKQRAQPKDFADIIISEPVRIRVTAAVANK